MSSHGGDPDALLEDRARSLARPTTTERAPTIPSLVAERHGERYAVPLAAIGEVLRVGHVTSVPAHLHPVVGLAAVRGRVAAVLELGGLLGQPPDSRRAAGTWGIALAGTATTTVVLVDEVRGIDDVDPAELPPDPTDEWGAVRGVTRSRLTMLDAARLLAAADHATRPGDA